MDVASVSYAILCLAVDVIFVSQRHSLPWTIVLIALSASHAIVADSPSTARLTARAARLRSWHWRHALLGAAVQRLSLPAAGSRCPPGVRSQRRADTEPFRDHRRRGAAVWSQAAAAGRCP
jgi:hypothetical protein